MKKQKIVITGCLGYIGTQLCKLYSGEAWYKDIIGIDSKFVSESVSQLRHWGIRFHQCSILDKERLSELLADTDIVYHLAGITDVAYTATQSNPEQDELIRSVGIEGTMNVIKSVSSSCKIIFPSTHVVFEGLTETTFDITEDYPNAPRFTYARGKLISESDIQMRSLVNNNHIIVRLGSVYGYSTDTMRINIMPNLFSKIASQNGTINLFGGGVQYKSLVHVVDVVRAMKFLAESDHTGTYHLSNENMTVKQVAEICKSINPLVTLTDTIDEIPNLGYTLSNQKLLDTGFKFLYNITDAIREMITKWSEQPIQHHLEYCLRGGKDYVDNRGKITNYELPEPINLIGWIESKKGTVRANHYHPIQEQKCLLISGRYISVTKDLSIPNTPLQYKLIRSGDIAVIKPNVVHSMVFLQNSLFLNLVNGERDHENYGITHTIPYMLVDEDQKNSIMNSELVTMYKTTCRVCESTDLEKIVDLGMSPLANNLLDSPNDPCDMYPLELMYCPHCFNVQLSVVVPPPRMFDNYLYVSSTSQVFRQHFEQAAEKYIQQFNPGIVWDIGSNDGVFLKPLQERGITVCGIEPAQNVCDIANGKGIPTIHGYFNNDIATQAYQLTGSPDIITASNVFAHADDLAGITRTVFANLKLDGIFIIEVQYLIDTIKNMTFDNIYHEHVNYWSVTTLAKFFDILGLCMFHVEHIDTHGGSIRCYIQRNSIDNPTVQEFIEREGREGVHQVETFKVFGERIAAIKSTVQKNMKLLRQKYKSIIGYGSPAKATTALNYFGITDKDIPYTVDDNIIKQGKRIPGVGTLIVQNVTGTDLVIVLAWNFYDSIVEKLGNTLSISIKDLEITDGMPILDTNASELTGTKSTDKVYDCFLFFNELDLLELRLNILDPIVDYFVICEANITHSGVQREYCFQEHMLEGRFMKFANKIIYLKVDNIPDEFENLTNYDLSSASTLSGEERLSWNTIVSYIQNQTVCTLTNKPACREQWQRASILISLSRQNCTSDDIIMLSDIDEISNPNTLQTILNNFDNNQIYSLRQNSYYYKLNLLKEKHWVGPRLSSFNKFQQYAPITFRHIRDLIIANGGWHFSFQTASGVANKIQAYSHSDMATDEVMGQLDNRIANNIDPYDRGKLKPVPLDNTFPQYLLDNIEQYKHMIL